MTITQVSAEIMVSDHAVAVAWYGRLLGREPDRRPMEALAEWQLTETASLQVFADSTKAGHSGVTIGVDDLDAHLADVGDLAVDAVRQTTPRGQPLALLKDPDGNLVVFAQDL